MIIQGDCLDVLSGLDDGRFHCCVTSPPYYGLRDYGVDGRLWPAVEYQPMPGLPALAVPEWEGCLGQEPTPEMFVAHIVLIFREVRRVLRDDGTLWLNFGDSYACGRPGGAPGDKSTLSRHGDTGRSPYLEAMGKSVSRRVPDSLKPKDLVGIPWRVAFALQADGWYLRQDVIWAKPNPMPESVRDRFTKAHEYIFLFSKSGRYYYDREAVKEDSAKFLTEGIRPRTQPNGLRADAAKIQGGYQMQVTETRNRRSVWTIATQPCADAHFAVYPAALIEPCILAGAPVDGHVLDPFGGAGTTGIACKRHRRHYTLIELKEEHCAIARRRIEAEPHPQLGLFE